MSKAAILNFPEPKDARLYYLDKKTNRHKRLSDNIFRDLQYVTRPNDRKKRISLKARNLLTNLLQMILKNPHKEEFVDHKFLSQITEVYSSKQNANLLDQISDIIDSTYHSYINFYGKHKTYGYVIKLTEDGYERAKNPVAFYTDSSGKIFPSESKKISTREEKNFQLYKDKENPEEEINHSYANGFISEKEKTYKKENPSEHKHATSAPCLLTQQEQVALTANQEKAIELDRKNRSNEHTGLFAMSDLMAKVLNEPTKQEEITEMNLEELPKLTEKEERTILLSRALWQTFGEQRSGEIQDDYKFVEIHEHKVCIQAREMQLNDIEKVKIRKAIQSVYGQDVILAMQIIVSTTEKSTPSNENVRKTATWLDFKATIKTNSMITMLTNPVLKTIEIPGKVIIETVPFLIERLTSPGYLDELERSVLETGLMLELRVSNTHPEYKNFNKDAIVISPEKILKDMEFRETCKPLVLSEILEEAKRNKEEQNNE
ncbi:MAG: hypothetical protein H6910_04960 [Rickettsiaceae bacterium]|nr:hypothetical protein [Rickettsiaceae bacterium]MCP5378450.1 hypothetical protein [Rickettsiaceae bacterium]